MVQAVDLNRPVYNAVNINIKKPEVNAAGVNNSEQSSATNPAKNNGIYNAVRISIDKPKVNTQPQKIYDYPEADGIVTYEMLSVNPVQTEEVSAETKELPAPEKSTETTDIKTEEVEVPAPNYTTTEAEKEDSAEKKTLDTETKLSFRGTEKSVKKPEIVPSEAILPKIDIAAASQNLTSSDKDVQAKQIAEIAGVIDSDRVKAKEYLVSDIFTNLIHIAETDATKLAPPTKHQLETRKKLIANIKSNLPEDKLPYKLSKEEIGLALNLSPLELVERNKEYALTVLGALAELFIEDYQAKEGRIVPITDVPGVSSIVNVLRKDPDPSVKMYAIDALRQIRRAEYKEDLSAIFTLAQNSNEAEVARFAALSLAEVNKL